MPSVYDRLTGERQKLQERIEKIEGMLQKYRDLESEAAKIFLTDTAVPVFTGATHVYNNATPSASGEASTSMVTPTPIPEYEQHLREILTATERPIQRSNLLKMLNERGVVVGGAKELNTLGTRLHRTDWVVNLKGHGYWLRDRGYGPAGHSAGEIDVGLVKLKPVGMGKQSDPSFPGYEIVEKS